MPSIKGIIECFQSLEDKGLALSKAGFTPKLLALVPDTHDAIVLATITDSRYAPFFVEIGQKLPRAHLEVLVRDYPQLFVELVNKPEFFHDMVCGFGATVANIIHTHNDNKALTSYPFNKVELQFMPDAFQKQTGARRMAFLCGAAAAFINVALDRQMDTSPRHAVARILYNTKEASNLAMVCTSTWQAAIHAQRAVEKEQNTVLKLAS
jgi:hypothetical protein